MAESARSVKTIKGIKRYKQSQLLAVGIQPIWRLKPSAVCVPVCTSDDAGAEQCVDDDRG